MRLAFTGTTITVAMRAVEQTNWIDVYLDGQRTDKLEIGTEWKDYTLATGLTDIQHTLEIVKATEGYEGIVEIGEIQLSDNAEIADWPTPDTHRIEFIGDSITCGYGIESNDRNEHWSPSTENFCDTYAWHTIRALNADYTVVARSGIGMLRNYNGPREGSEENLPSLYERSFFRDAEPVWDFRRFTPDIVCINLGTNDFSTTGVDPIAYEAAYLTFVNRILKQYPQARIVCLLGPMLNSPDVKAILHRVANVANQNLGTPRVFHFEMTAQGSLGYGADWHPSKAQAFLNGKELTAYLRGLMNW